MNGSLPNLTPSGRRREVRLRPFPSLGGGRGRGRGRGRHQRPKRASTASGAMELRCPFNSQFPLAVPACSPPQLPFRHLALASPNPTTQHNRRFFLFHFSQYQSSTALLVESSHSQVLPSFFSFHPSRAWLRVPVGLISGGFAALRFLAIWDCRCGWGNQL